MSYDKAHGFKCCRSIFCLEFEVSLSTVGFDLFVCRRVRAMDVVCTEKAHNKSLIYSGVYGRFARCPFRPESFRPDPMSIRPESEVVLPGV